MAKLKMTPKKCDLYDDDPHNLKTTYPVSIKTAVVHR